MHCLLKWLATESSKQQCPMDRRPWGTFFSGTASIRFELTTSMMWVVTAGAANVVDSNNASNPSTTDVELVAA